MQTELTAHHGRMPLTVIVSGLPSDSHTWNLVFLQLLLEDLGHRVNNLGPCVPASEIVSACRAAQPDLLVISSVNGHGARDARSVIALLRATEGIASLPTVIGGKLGVQGADDWRLTEDLLEAGYDAVFVDGTGVTRFESLVSDLCLEMAA